MSVTRRNFLGLAPLLAGQAGAAAVAGLVPQLSASQSNSLAEQSWQQKGAGRRTIERELKRVQAPSLKPPWRLPVSWYRSAVGRLQSKLREGKLGGALVTDGLNQNYLGGFFLTQTERPMWLWVPASGEPAFFHPGLDRDLAENWWIKDHEWYFDFLHTGGYDQVVWEAGPEEDLWKWVCERLKKRGAGSGKLALDLEAPPSLAQKLKENLPEVEWVDWSKELLHLRQVKTPEEIALTRKALALHDAMLEFSRTFILEHGTDVRDYDVGLATSEFGARKLMEALGPELDGRPHTGVGLYLGFECRTGPATAYPHPNQFFFKRIEPGDAIQVASLIQIGGYGGEGYRACHIEPIPEPGKKMWEVHTAMTLKQAELSQAGVKCNQVAEGVLKLARDAGFGKYVYHRPAHGQGMEGHQAPYISPGDNTVLEENMMFSNEPGLYNAEGGFGYNHSNNILVQKERGEVMNKTPLTKEWCWLKL